VNRSKLGIEDTDKQEMVEAHVDENTSTIPESAGRTQNTTETKPEESMIAMKNDILRKWETVKYQEITERPLLPKIKKDHRARDTIDTANKAIKEIKEGSYRKRGSHDIMGHANTHRQENNSQQTRYSD